MTTFRDAIARMYAESEGLVAGGCTCGDCGMAIADALLAMPEMESLREALRILHRYCGPNYLEVGLDLPEHLVAWVLGEDQ